ncbi:Uncharacterised protein [Achromobacter spanius]|nr:hypothetical protein LMG5911_02324 [Achromobacter spanius]SPT42040.1 Uncharacterised protein [Achromobacter denitrificans]VEE59412.1 Uncharacterised protein [Achromobacter spanius]
MFGWFLSLISSLFGFWEKLPDSTKKKVVDATVDAFDYVFRSYYKSQKGRSHG